MSKAIEWAEQKREAEDRMDQARAARPGPFVFQGNDLEFCVSDDGEPEYRIDHRRRALDRSVLLSFARWILDTFDD